MVAGFAEVVERKEFFGCGGLQCTEAITLILPFPYKLAA
jgi:hypothetical protein